jgi:hypothetical protein
MRALLVALLALVLPVAPLAVEAQPAGKVPRVAFLFYGSSGPSRELARVCASSVTSRGMGRAR